jgi:hypothetical protein
MKSKLLLATLLVVFIAACAEKDVSSAERSETIELTAVVQEIDTAERRFVVKGGGRTTTLRASDSVKNFDQLAVGDEIKLYYAESIAVDLADPTVTGQTTLETKTVTSEEGAKPGGGTADLLTVPVEFLAYNRNNHVATIKSSDGTVFDVEVAPEMRSFATSRTPGDLIVVQMLQAVAVFVEPAS